MDVLMLKALSWRPMHGYGVLLVETNRAAGDPRSLYV